jgi:hypothetical protein
MNIFQEKNFTTFKKMKVMNIIKMKHVLMCLNA